MNAMFFTNLGIFMAMQVAAQVFMKLGSQDGGSMKGRRWWWGFIAANAVGAPSILFLRDLYKAMPEAPNVVVVTVLAGVFILTQMVFIGFFKTRLSVIQWAGVVMLALGALLASTGA